MDKLKPCPCGEVPDVLCIEDSDCVKYSHAFGSCCNEWIIEFRSDYKTGDELDALAVNAWNAAPRKADTITTREPNPSHESL